MSDSLTKRALAYVIKDMLNEKPLSRISVSALCERCGMNRKRFYYHFPDKYSLVCWIARSELEQLLDTCTGDHLTAVCRLILNDRVFYQRIFDEPEYCGKELHAALAPMLQPLCPDSLSEEEQQFCMDFLTDAFSAAMRRWLAEDDPMPPERCASLIHAMCAAYGRPTPVEGASS
ncbi:MAG: TetR/AcrR family transcriptional regulator C-terminal domain-containing protein [Butyricicoccaceae bacterium]